jgi:hypothetical protein
MSVINWQEVEAMTSEHIENLRVSIIKELQTMEDNHQIVKDEYMSKGREMIMLEGQKKDLQIALSRSSHSIKSKKSNLDILTTKFWQSRK